MEEGEENSKRGKRKTIFIANTKRRRVPIFVWHSLISALDAVPSDAVRICFSSIGVATAVQFSSPKRARILPT